MNVLIRNRMKPSVIAWNTFCAGLLLYGTVRLLPWGMSLWPFVGEGRVVALQSGVFLGVVCCTVLFCALVADGITDHL